MTRRQIMPAQWLVVDARAGRELISTIQQIPFGSGVLLLRKLGSKDFRRVRNLARLRGLIIVEEQAGEAARIHDMRELRKALQKRNPFLFVSPIHRTESHPNWQPLPRMRAATLARLGKRKVIALGGMNKTCFDRIRPLGFTSWAGISAFRT